MLAALILTYRIIFSATAENFITSTPTTMGDTYVLETLQSFTDTSDYTYWYDAATGGNLVGEGNEFKISNSVTTSYYAEAVIKEGLLKTSILIPVVISLSHQTQLIGLYGQV